MSTPDDGRISSPLVLALERMWDAIRAQHPDLPPVVIVLGAGSVGNPAGGLRLGHFAAMRWHDTTTPVPAAASAPAPAPTPGAKPEEIPEAVGGPGSAVFAEVFIGGEGLARGPVATLGTLLHEAAHALAHARGIKDTSRQGRWHNARFKALAEEVSVTVAKDPRLGWSTTSVPDRTRGTYADALAELAAVMRVHRVTEPAHRAANARTGPPRVACDCGRSIRIARAALDAGPVTCGLCGTEFTARDTDQP